MKPDLSNITYEKIREAAEAIQELLPKALDEYREFAQTTGKRLSGDEKQREAYLRGVLHGVALAVREIEQRAPIRFCGSGCVDRDTKIAEKSQ